MPPGSLSRTSALWVLVAVLATGCEAPESLSAPSMAASRTVHLTRRQPSGEDHFRRLAEVSDEFAGYYYDSDRNLVIHAAHSAPSQALFAAVDSIWSADAKHFEGEARGTIRYVAVDYSFRELAGWRDELLDLVFNIPGVRSLDMDEVNNRVSIGVAASFASSARTLIEEALANRMIPSGAIRISAVGPLEYTAAVPPRTQQLTDFQRPIQAGFQYTHKHGSVEHGCSIGWVTLNDLEPAIVGASHCSTLEGLLDGGTFYQHRDPNAIGVEIAEAEAYTCGGIPCHYGDVNVVGLSGSVQYEENVIGRTTITPLGSITINASKPRFYAVEEYAQSVVGMVVGRTGITTGWRVGYVEATCTAYQIDSPWINLCMDRVSAYSDEGDSGGPVFKVIDDAASTVRLAGFVSARGWYLSCLCWNYIFTPMHVVHSEFSGLEHLFQ